MKGIENLLGMVGLDPEKLTRMFAHQLDQVRLHYDQAFARLTDAVRHNAVMAGVAHAEAMNMLHRLDERLDVIEASLARIDPEFVSADFMRHYNVDMKAQGIGTDTPAVSLIEHEGMAHS